MNWTKINWKVVGTVAAIFAAVFVLLAIFIGITKAFAAAGALGAGAGAAYRQRQRRQAIASGDTAKDRISEVRASAATAAARLSAQEGEIKKRVSALSDEEKVRLGEDLLGGGG